MHPTLISLPVVITILTFHTVTVQGRIRPSVEQIASDYIVKRLFPSHSILASKLLNVLVKSVEDEHQKQLQQHQEEEKEQQRYNSQEDEDHSVEENTLSLSENGRVADETPNDLLASDEDISEDGISISNNRDRNSFETILGRAGRQRDQQIGFGRRIRRLHQQQQKRGLGRCIHNCINGSGHMNFIQCKSMCH